MGQEENRIKEVYASRIDGDKYSWFSPGHTQMTQSRQRHTLKALKKHGISNLSDLKILEIGCGTGAWLRDLIQWGAEPKHLYGMDLLKDRIQIAKEKLPQSVHLEQGTANQLPYESGQFDIVLQSTVFSSILDEQLRKEIADEMVRILDPHRGLVLWYDFHMNNPKNPDVMGITQQEILRLFPNLNCHLYKTTLAPPLSRRISPFSQVLASSLEFFPFLCTHTLGLLKNN